RPPPTHTAPSGRRCETSSRRSPSTTRSTSTSPSRRRKRCARYRNTIPTSPLGTSRSRTDTPTAISSTRTVRTSMRRSSLSTSARDTGPDLAEDQDELYLEIALPSRLPRFPQEPVARGLHERVLAPAPRQSAPPRLGDSLHVVHGWALVLPLPDPHAHRDAPHVLLPPVGGW